MARILIGNIRGPQGIQGPQGPQGKQGIQGPAGPLPPLINNALATEAGIAALDAAMGKTLGDKVDRLNLDLGKVNTNLNGTVLMGGNADIKAYARSLSSGMHYVTTTAETVNVPNGYNYCAGYILKRSSTSIMIALFNGSCTAQCVYSTDTWLDWKTAVPKSDLGNEIITAQFSDGVYVRNGNIKSGNYSVITVTQKYGGVKNVTFATDLTSSGYAVYARNANDGSNYNGTISLYVFAAK